MEYQVKKPSHAAVPLNRKMDVLEDAHDFFMSSVLATPSPPLLPGAVKETPRRRLAVTSSLDPQESYGKYGGGEGGRYSTPRTPF
jgi:hypothetical protein